MSEKFKIDPSPKLWGRRYWILQPVVIESGFRSGLIHFSLFFWAAGGVLEMTVTKVPWKPFTNPEFPFWVLDIHWGSVLFASLSFLYGYFTRWAKTPQIMAISNGIMAFVCIIETFGYMTSKAKYLAMGAEFLTYAIILLLIFKSRYFIDRFNQN